MMRSKLWIATLASVLLVACGGVGRSPLGYWADLSSEVVLADVSGSEERFVEWAELLTKSDSVVQKSAVEEFVDAISKDEICYYVYTEWAMNYLYGIWSPVRNEFAFEHILHRMATEEATAVYDKSHINHLLKILRHNRQGGFAEDFRMYDVDGNESNLSDLRGNNVLLLMVDTTCPSCVDFIKLVESQKGIMKASRRGELSLVVVAMSASKEMLADFAKLHEGSMWQIFSASRSDLDRAFYDVEASPMLFFLNPSGKIVVPMTRDVKAVEKSVL